MPGYSLTPTSKILILAAEDSPHTSDVQSILYGTLSFSTVDVFDLRYSVPTTTYLNSYHAVLVWFDYPAPDVNLVGDVLASYHDAGGGVVVALFANAPLAPSKPPIQGMWGNRNNKYTLSDYASSSSDFTADVGEVQEISSPLVSSFVSITASWKGIWTPINNATTVAKWSRSGQPLILRGTRGKRTLVELNLYPPSQSSYPNGGWVGSGASIMRNALLYSRCVACDAGSYAPNGEL